MDPIKENHRNHVNRQQPQHHPYHQQRQHQITQPLSSTPSVASAPGRYSNSRPSNHFSSSLPPPPPTLTSIQPVTPSSPPTSLPPPPPPLATVSRSLGRGVGPPYIMSESQATAAEQSDMLQHLPPASSMSPAASPTPPTLSPPSPSSPLPPMSPSPTSLSSSSFTLTPLPPPTCNQDFADGQTAATSTSDTLTAAISPVDSCTTMSLSDSFVSQSASLCFQPNPDMSPTPEQDIHPLYTNNGDDISKPKGEGHLFYPPILNSEKDDCSAKDQPDKTKAIQPCHYQRLPYHIRSRPRPQRPFETHWEKRSLMSPSGQLENLCEENLQGTLRYRRSPTGSNPRNEIGRETGYGSSGGGVHSSESGSLSAVSSSGSLDGYGGFSNSGTLRGQATKREAVKCRQVGLNNWP